jgi:hypothetical protein
MNKQQIIDEIRRLASVAGGKAPGSQRFESETGIRKSSWYPQYWLRWGDAVREAGFQPNSLNTAFSTDFLVTKYIDLIRELGRFPIDGDLAIKRQGDKTFPNRGAFNSLGPKALRAAQILAYCRGHENCVDIIPFCAEVLSKIPPDRGVLPLENRMVGYVYLVKHGSRREYKIGKTRNPVRREGEFALQLPEKLEPVHYIKTDDPSGVEKYWHTRFAEKRKEGEWFALTATDVRAFKRWRRIY